MDYRKLRISVVLPTYNERDNLEPLVQRILQLGPEYDVVIVDDDSPDGTGELADRLAAEHPGRIDVVHRKVRSRATAGLDGFRRALQRGADLVVEMDADFSHDPGEVPRLVGQIAGVDVVIGSRYIEGGRVEGRPLGRDLTGRSANLYARLLLGPSVADWCGGFKVYRASALARLDFAAFRAKEHSIGIELLFRLRAAGATFKEVPITFRERTRGVSKFSPYHIAEYLFMPWALRWDGLSTKSPRFRSLALWARDYGTFIVGGGIGALLNWSITVALTELSHLWYLVGFAIGIACNVAFNYYYNNFITFQAGQPRLSTGARYGIVSAFVIVAILALTYLLTDVLGIFYLYSIIASTIVMSVLSFEINKSWVFRT